MKSEGVGEYSASFMGILQSMAVIYLCNGFKIMTGWTSPRYTLQSFGSMPECLFHHGLRNELFRLLFVVSNRRCGQVSSRARFRNTSHVTSEITASRWRDFVVLILLDSET